MKQPGLLILLCLGAAAQTSVIEPAGGAWLELIVEKTGLLSGKRHVLRWERFEGGFSTAPPTARLSVEAASVRVLDDWLGDSKREDVRKETVGKDVLDTQRHARIEFVSTAVSGKVDGEFQIQGNLTVRGISKPVTLKAKRITGGYEGEAEFSMSAFGIKPPRAALGAIGTKDAMRLRFQIPSR